MLIRKGGAMGRKFTLIELLVVIAIIAILASLLLPSLRGAMESAKRLSCGNRFKQMATAMNCYVDDNGGFLPGPSVRMPYLPEGSSAVNNNFVLGLNVYLKKPGAWWKCPSNGEALYRIDFRTMQIDNAPSNPYFGYPSGSGSDALPRKLNSIAAPSMLWCANEINMRTVPETAYAATLPPHLLSYNALYFDGHLETKK